jgi:hypothetical protein
MPHPPHEKRTPANCTKKNWQHFKHLRTGRYEEEVLYKAEVGQERAAPVCEAPNYPKCSSAVASRLA